MRTENNYIRTYTGRKFWPTDPRVEDVDVTDIAHALSNTCRWGGHCVPFYSVAQHAVLCSQQAFNKHQAFVMLHHDDSEAYLTDIPSPLKAELPDFRRFEDQLMRVLSDALGFLWPMNEDDHYIDKRMLATEAAQLFKTSRENFGDPFKIEINPWPPHVAAVKFIERHLRIEGGLWRLL